MSTAYVNYSGWYYCAEMGFFGGIKYIEADRYCPEAWVGNIYGPFKTFGEAKKDALNYFRTDIDTARLAMASVREHKKRESP